MLKVARDTAVALLTELGSKAAHALPDARLAKRLQKLPDSLDPEETYDQVETPEAAKLLKKILKDSSILDEVEIVDAESNGHAAKGKKGAKPAKEEPADEDNGDEEAEADEEEGDEDEDSEEESEADEEEGDEDETVPVKPAKKNATKAGKNGKAKKGSKPRQGMSCIDAAAKVLTETKKPLNCKEMIEKMKTKGYWTTPGGATPHATLASAILREITTKGKKSRFKKTSPGHFAAPGLKAK